jgi:hypothetical protein
MFPFCGAAALYRPERFSSEILVHFTCIAKEQNAAGFIPLHPFSPSAPPGESALLGTQHKNEGRINVQISGSLITAPGIEDE